MKNAYGYQPGIARERGPEVPAFNQELALSVAFRVEEEITFDCL
jgi:hypothetical protein